MVVDTLLFFLMFDLSSLATVCRLVMSNNHTSPILPMPAAMAGLPSGFDIARGVLAEVGRKMEAGGEFCDTTLLEQIALLPKICNDA